MEKVDKVWSCKMCGKTSGRQKDHLRDHVKIHVQPSQMSCRLCGKVFKNQRTEETHTKTCKGQKFQGNSLFRVKKFGNTQLRCTLKRSTKNSFGYFLCIIVKNFPCASLVLPGCFLQLCNCQRKSYRRHAVNFF